MGWRGGSGGGGDEDRLRPIGTPPLPPEPPSRVRDIDAVEIIDATACVAVVRRCCGH